jgi:hypothetical protein
MLYLKKRKEHLPAKLNQYRIKRIIIKRKRYLHYSRYTIAKVLGKFNDRYTRHLTKRLFLRTGAVISRILVFLTLFFLFGPHFDFVID